MIVSDVVGFLSRALCVIEEALGSLFVRLRAVRAGERLLARAARGCSDRLAVRVKLAEVLAARGRFNEALDHYRYLVDAGEAIEGWIGHGFVMQRIGDHRQALESFERVLERDAENFSALYHVSESYLATGRLPEALNVLRRLEQLYPDDADVLAQYADVLCRLGRLNDAVEYRRRALALRPALETAYNLGQDLLESKRFDEAVDAFRQGLSLPHTSGGPLSLAHVRGAMAFALSEAGRRDEAIELLQSSRTFASPELVMLSEIQIETHKFDEAVTTAKRAVQVDANNACVHAQLARALLYAERPHDAYDEALAARRLAPDDLLYQAIEAGALSDLGRHEEALSGFERLTVHHEALFRDNPYLEERWRRSRAAEGRDGQGS